MTDHCDYSDLPTWACAHCPPTSPPAPGPLAAHRPTPLRVVHPIATQPPSPKPSHLPEDTSRWDLTAYVTALCDPTIATEKYRQLHNNDDGSLTTVTGRHKTTSPPLLEQLWSAAETSRGMDNGHTRGFQSSPAASLEALDVALDIEHTVHKLLRTHGIIDSHDHYPDTIKAVRKLGSLVAPGEHTTHKDEARTIRHWWVAARVITGWDLPAFRPNNTCPMCGIRGSLRIKWPTGFCTQCRTVWDEEHSGLLVEHIRRENHEDEDTGVGIA